MVHGDLTGKTKAELTAKVAKEQAAKAKQMAMITAEAESNLLDEPVELKTIESHPVVDPNEAVDLGDGLTQVEVDEREKKVQFRVNTDLENVTIGYGNTYDFIRGQVYNAPKSVYDYLEYKELIWH